MERWSSSSFPMDWRADLSPPSPCFFTRDICLLAVESLEQWRLNLWALAEEVSQSFMVEAPVGGGEEASTVCTRLPLCRREEAQFAHCVFCLFWRREPMVNLRSEISDCSPSQSLLFCRFSLSFNFLVSIRAFLCFLLAAPCSACSSLQMRLDLGFTCFSWQRISSCLLSLCLPEPELLSLRSCLEGARVPREGGLLGLEMRYRLA
mmetsp:Transcript_3169/g.5289  ORF Transcript_3169/g.5289 Transcript_3169/m.5289 type:complete len:206 (-) Transcript_3169:217-834(-)